MRPCTLCLLALLCCACNDDDDEGRPLYRAGVQVEISASTSI